jgi:hypothetical protein
MTEEKIGETCKHQKRENEHISVCGKSSKILKMICFDDVTCSIRGFLWESKEALDG